MPRNYHHLKIPQKSLQVLETQGDIVKNNLELPPALLFRFDAKLRSTTVNTDTKMVRFAWVIVALSGETAHQPSSQRFQGQSKAHAHKLKKLLTSILQARLWLEVVITCFLLLYRLAF